MSFKIGVGEPIHRFNLGAAQASSKIMLLKGGHLIGAYIPGPVRMGRIDLTRESITDAYLKQMEASGLTHLLVLDQDLLFPPDLIARLLSHRLPLVAGLYIKRDKDSPVPLMFYEEDGRLRVAVDWTPGALVPCDLTGAGAVLIANEVLTAMSAPRWACGSGAIDGEDFHFFRRAKAAGYQLYVDTGCVCEHFIEAPAALDEFLEWRDRQ